jgi:hypothetical protein
MGLLSSFGICVLTLNPSCPSTPQLTQKESVNFLTIVIVGISNESSIRKREREREIKPGMYIEDIAEKKGGRKQDGCSSTTSLHMTNNFSNWRTWLDHFLDLRASPVATVKLTFLSNCG